MVVTCYQNIFGFVLLLVLALLLAGCDGREQIDIQVDDIHIRAELAATPKARQTGLMHRESLGRDEGLLLAFPQAGVVSIWMRNTLIPLDVGFFDREGRLLNWTSMQPDGGRTIHRSRGSALYALEMNEGWFEGRGVGEGARLRLPYSIDAN